MGTVLFTEDYIGGKCTFMRKKEKKVKFVTFFLLFLFFGNY